MHLNFCILCIFDDLKPRKNRKSWKKETNIYFLISLD